MGPWDEIRTIVDIATLPLISALGLMVKMLHEANIKRLEALDNRLDHVDKCIDEVKQHVATNSLAVMRDTMEFVREPEFTRVRSIVQADMAAMNVAISRFADVVMELRERMGEIRATQAQNMSRIESLERKSG
jgi:hypothetical protein